MILDKQVAQCHNEDGEICSILTDIDDEIEAYTAQFSYDPNSIPGHPKTILEINAKFIEGLLDQNGQLLYSTHSNAFTSKKKINILTPISTIIEIYKYPSNIVRESSMNLPIYQLQGIYSVKFKSFK